MRDLKEYPTVTKDNFHRWNDTVSNEQLVEDIRDTEFEFEMKKIGLERLEAAQAVAPLSRLDDLRLSAYKQEVEERRQRLVFLNALKKERGL